MTDQAWKAFERRMAAIFHGRRRGAYTGGQRPDGRLTGKTDIICPGWAVECKLLSRPAFSDLLAAARQAEANAESPADIPVALVKRKGDPDANTLVVMRLERFEEFFRQRVKQEEK